MKDLISRQAVIDLLKQMRKDGDMVPWEGKDVFARIRELPSAQPEPKWIPCSERLPIAKHKTYWICTDTGHQCECRWTNVNHFWTNLTTEWHWHIMDIPQYSKVVAWRELPDPWEGVKTMTDLISRQAAIDTVKSRKTAEQCEKGEVRNWAVDLCIDALNKLPSEQPEIIRCRDCRYKYGSDCDNFAGVLVEDDYFCSMAERREVGE